MKKIGAALAISLAAGTIPHSTSAEVMPRPSDPRDEKQLRESISSFVRDFRQSGRIDLLEAWSIRFRDRRSRTPSGVWRLSVMYRSLSDWAPVGSHVSNREKFPAWSAVGTSWKRDFPNSPTRHIAHAEVLIKEAWQARGSGYANEVWPDAWKVFRAKLSEARDYLERHKDTASVDPHWYAVMLKIHKALGASRLKIYELFEESFQREPLYYENYFQVVNALSPRWGGSEVLVEAFIERAVRKTRSMIGESMRARLYWVLYHEKFVIERFRTDETFWKKLKPAIRDLIAQHPNIYNLQAHMRAACQAGNTQAIAWIAEQGARMKRPPHTWTTLSPERICNVRTARNPIRNRPIPAASGSK